MQSPCRDCNGLFKWNSYPSHYRTEQNKLSFRCTVSSRRSPGRSTGPRVPLRAAAFPRGLPSHRMGPHTHGQHLHEPQVSSRDQHTSHFNLHLPRLGCNARVRIWPLVSLPDSESELRLGAVFVSRQDPSLPIFPECPSLRPFHCAECVRHDPLVCRAISHY